MDDERDGLDSPGARGVVIGILALVAVGGALDLYLDAPTRWLTAHVLVEVALMTASAASAVYLWRGWRRTARHLAGAVESLAAREAERDEWRRRAEVALAGLGREIAAQFAAWGLTAAEREVALLLLKGSGHKQIAAATGRSERTVRQHAVAVYEKSRLRGRAELAAYFLEGLMLPGGDGAEATGPK